uniref:IRS-type PTB domain-containing protein n=1 Tax=Taenia asiatica TaxID=60517 RepID=A0A0R3W0P9_TAEAS
LTLRADAEPSITLQPVRLPNGNVELQCTASGDDVETAMIRLGCGIRSSKVCRENCTLFCPLIDGKMQTGTMKSGRAGALSRHKKLKSAPQAKELQHPNPDGDAAKLQGLAKGGPRNSATETCLCLKGLADTYRPRRFGFARGGHRGGGEGSRSNMRWSRMVAQGSFKLPLTEPTPRRKPLTALTYFPSYHHEQLCPPSDPSQPPLEEVIYDDVHQSTIYLTKGDLASQQNPISEVYPTGVPSSSGNGQNYIVDQNGMVYLAMGHVSQTPKQLRSNLAASRVTLTTFQPENSSKLDQQSQGRRNSSHSGQLPSLHTPSTSRTPRRESNDAIQKTPSINPDLSGLPPQPLRAVPSQYKTKTPSIQSSLNPPIPFADQINSNDDFDDIFDMSKDTLLPRHHSETKKPNPEPL